MVWREAIEISVFCCSNNFFRFSWQFFQLIGWSNIKRNITSKLSYYFIIIAQCSIVLWKIKTDWLQRSKTKRSLRIKFMRRSLWNAPIYPHVHHTSNCWHIHTHTHKHSTNGEKSCLHRMQCVCVEIEEDKKLDKQF